MSEVRVIIYLTQCDKELSYARVMSTKLNIDYAYLLKTLANLKYKRWIKISHKHKNRTYYQTTPKAPYTQAKELLYQKALERRKKP